MDVADDLRQIIQVAKYEVMKFMRSRKFLIYSALTAAVVLLITFLPYVLGGNLGDTAGEAFSTYVGFVSLLVLLGATLFASYTLVSEFEERTALILFTRPIKRVTIFAGKFLSCFVLVGAIMVAYYLVAFLAALAATGSLITSFLPSMAMCLAYVFATTGVAMLVSSLFKKGGTAAVVTFLAVLLVVPIVSSAASGAGVDTWFMLDQASTAISNSVPEYVEMTNGVLESMGEAMGVDMSGMMVQAADCVRSGSVMVAWGAVATLASLALFTRREF